MATAVKVLPSNPEPVVPFARPSRFTMGDVRSEGSFGRNRVLSAARKVIQFIEGEGGSDTYQRQYLAASFALELDALPTVSFAIRAHELCLEALQEQLDNWGATFLEFTDLMDALACLINSQWLVRGRGAWRDQGLDVRLDSLSRGVMPELLWDADGIVQATPRSEESS